MEWSDALVDTNDVLQCIQVHSLPVRQMNDAEENLNPTILDVPDSASFSVNCSVLMHEMDIHPN